MTTTKGDLRESEAAQRERDDTRAYAKRKLRECDDVGFTAGGDEWRALLRWLDGRAKRFNARPGGLGAK